MQSPIGSSAIWSASNRPRSEPGPTSSIADEALRRTEGMDTVEENVGIQIERLLEYRQALITAAVTGQLDIASEAVA